MQNMLNMQNMQETTASVKKIVYLALRPLFLPQVPGTRCHERCLVLVLRVIRAYTHRRPRSRRTGAEGVVSAVAPAAAPAAEAACHARPLSRRVGGRPLLPSPPPLLLLLLLPQPHTRVPEAAPGGGGFCGSGAWAEGEYRGLQHLQPRASRTASADPARY